MNRIKNLKDTIFLTIYSEPRYASEVSKILYGKENKRVFLEIKKLVNDNWLTESSYTAQINDKRSKTRKYYQARIDPIIVYIEKSSEKLLGRTEEHFLKSILDSQAFKYLIKKQLPQDLKVRSVNAIDFILTYLDILFIISDRNELFRKRSKGIKKISDYENAIEGLKKDKKFIAKLPELTEILFRQKDVQPEVKKHLPYLFIIPEKLSFCHPGFSDFGKKYYGITSISRGVSKLLET